MAAIWPAHRQLCKKLALEPDANRALSSFTDWLSSLLYPLVFALPSAFDLATEPANASTKILIIELTLIEDPKLSFAIAEAELVDLLPNKRQPRPRENGLYDLVRRVSHASVLIEPANHVPLCRPLRRALRPCQRVGGRRCS